MIYACFDILALEYESFARLVPEMCVSLIIYLFTLR